MVLCPFPSNLPLLINGHRISTAWLDISTYIYRDRFVFYSDLPCLQPFCVSLSTKHKYNQFSVVSADEKHISLQHTGLSLK